MVNTVVSLAIGAAGALGGEAAGLYEIDDTDDRDDLCVVDTDGRDTESGDDEEGDE